MTMFISASNPIRFTEHMHVHWKRMLCYFPVFPLKSLFLWLGTPINRGLRKDAFKT